MAGGSGGSSGEVHIDEDGPAEVTVVGPVEILDPCRDIEQVLLTDEGTNPDTDFLRTYEYACDGTLIGFTDTLLDGTTGYAPVGPIVVTVQSAATRDIEQVVLCDTVGPFVRRYRYNPDGSFQGFLNLTLAGAPYVPVGAVVVCADVVSNFPSDREVAVLCDTVGAFLRRYNVTSAGVVTATDTTLNGVTPYVPVGAVGVCGGAATPGENTTSIIVTRIFDATAPANTRATSTLARRVTFIYTSDNSTLAERPTINGIPVQLVGNDNPVTVILGSLHSAVDLPVFTFVTRKAGEDALVIEEF
jgi:hypothetical protein